jgi:pyruvate/2-oxoglutarate dehydrogenase complex dihydrolipoamide acyltransferase (E2) component
MARPILVALAAVSLVGLVGCSSSKKSSTLAPTPTTAAATTAATTAAATSAAAPTMSLDTSTGLTEGEKVNVTAAGFPANDSLGINECAVVQGTVGAGDCDLRNLIAVTADASGNVTGVKTVTKGPFGADNVSCTATTPCLISVSELVPGNPKAASEPIAFG